MRTLLLLLTLLLAAGCAKAEPVGARAQFDEAMHLLHEYNRTGDELERALAIGEELGRTAPDSGYAETIEAEAISNVRLNSNGEPASLRIAALGLVREALARNPRLAEAYSVRARCYMRSGQYEDAVREANAALAIDPDEPTALFMLADTQRRMGKPSEEVEPLYARYIARIDSARRQAKAHAWIAVMHVEDAWQGGPDQPAHVAKARAAYERSVSLDPDALHVLGDFARFLADLGDDLDAAEQRAMESMNLGGTSSAMFAIAAVRYQRLAADTSLDATALSQAIAAVEAETSIPLADAANYCGFTRVKARLEPLQARLDDPRLFAGAPPCGPHRG
jgi:tetratricopeptide (TPR) repeat protein